MSDKKILKFLVDESEPEVIVRNALPGATTVSAQTKVVEITSDVVSKRINQTLNAFIAALDGVEEGKKYEISEVKLSLAVDASGEVSIVSLAKGHIGTKSEIQITLKRHARS